MSLRTCIYKKIAILITERILIERELGEWPKGTLGHARLELALNMWSIKISLWEELLPREH
jgi:hypothetical protein